MSWLFKKKSPYKLIHWEAGDGMRYERWKNKKTGWHLDWEINSGGRKKRLRSNPIKI